MMERFEERRRGEEEEEVFITSGDWGGVDQERMRAGIDDGGVLKYDGGEERMRAGEDDGGACQSVSLHQLLAEKLTCKTGTPITVGRGIGSSAALLESELLPLSFARSYWKHHHDKVDCDDEPPPGATVPLRAVREFFMERWGFWPTVSHPSPSVPRYQHTSEHASAEAAAVNEIEFCLFCLAADEEDINNAPDHDAFPPPGYVSLAGIPWDPSDFTNPW